MKVNIDNAESPQSSIGQCLNQFIEIKCHHDVRTIGVIISFLIRNFFSVNLSIDQTIFRFEIMNCWIVLIETERISKEVKLLKKFLKKATERSSTQHRTDGSSCKS